MEQPQVKFGFLIDRDLHERLNRLVPWGVKTRLLRNMLRRLAYELETGGNKALGDWLNWTPSASSRSKMEQ